MDKLCKISEKPESVRKKFFKDTPHAMLWASLLYTVIFSVTAAAYYIPIYRRFGIVAGGDGLSMYYPLLVNFRNTLREFFGLNGGTPLQFPIVNYNYSFGFDNFVLSFNFLPFLPYYIFCAFVPESGLQLFYSMGVVLLQFLSGLSFIYMCRYFRRDMLWSGLFAVGYSFCGNFLKSAVYNPQFIYMMIAVPLMAVGLDRMINRKGWKALMIGIILTGLSSFTFFVYTLPFLGLFAILRVWFLKKEHFFKELLIDFLRCMGVILIGVLICAVTILPTAYLIIHSVREVNSNEINIAKLFIPDLEKLTRLYLPLSSAGVFPFIMPAVMAAVTTVSAKTEHRVYMLVMSALIAFPVISYGINGFMYDGFRWCFIPGLLFCYIGVVGMEELPRLDRNDAFLFASSALIYAVIMSLEYEWLAALLVTILAAALMIPCVRNFINKLSGAAIGKLKDFAAWIKRNKDGSKRYLTALVLIIIFVPVSAFVLTIFISNRSGWEHLVSRVMIALAAVLIYKCKRLRALFLCTLVLVFSVSMPFSAVRKNQKNEFNILKHFEIYERLANSGTEDRSENIDTAYTENFSEFTEDKYEEFLKEDISNIKMLKSEYPIIYGNVANEALALGVPAVLTFNNLIDSDLLEYFDRIGQNADGYPSLVDIQSFSAKEPLYSLFGVKTMFTYKDPIPLYGAEQTGNLSADGVDYRIYTNKYAFPVGVTYDTFMSREDFTQLSEAYLPFAMMDSAYVEGFEGDTSVRLSENDSRTVCDITLKKEYLTTNDKDIDYYDNTVTINDDVSGCFLYITFDGVEIKNKTVMNFVTPLIYKSNDTGLIVSLSNELSSWPWKRTSDHYCISLGYCEDSIDKIRFTSPFRYDNVQLHAVPAEWFEQSYEARCAETLKNVNFGSGGISGDIEVSGDKLLSVNYLCNDGWRVYVDGKEQEICSVNDLFLGVMLEKGKHHIEFRYKTPWIGAGVLITAVGIAAAAVTETAYRKRRAKKN